MYSIHHHQGSAAYAHCTVCISRPFLFAVTSSSNGALRAAGRTTPATAACARSLLHFPLSLSLSISLSLSLTLLTHTSTYKHTHIHIRSRAPSPCAARCVLSEVRVAPSHGGAV
jgi:hypothetical protein